MKNSFSFLAKHISWKYIVLILILIYIILLTVPYLPHKTVSEEYKEKDAAAEYYSDTSGTERIAYITDNNDALLYRLGMIEEAENPSFYRPLILTMMRRGRIFFPPY